jgi:hypothetical protein
MKCEELFRILKKPDGKKSDKRARIRSSVKWVRRN